MEHRTDNRTTAERFVDRQAEIDAAEYDHHVAAMIRLIDVCEPISAKYPNTPIVQIIQMLPEPERSMAQGLWSAAVEYGRRTAKRNRPLGLASGVKE